jgi:hypothetical protein
MPGSDADIFSRYCGMGSVGPTAPQRPEKVRRLLLARRLASTGSDAQSSSR